MHHNLPHHPRLPDTLEDFSLSSYAHQALMNILGPMSRVPDRILRTDPCYRITASRAALSQTRGLDHPIIFLKVVLMVTPPATHEVSISAPTALACGTCFIKSHSWVSGSLTTRTEVDWGGQLGQGVRGAGSAPPALTFWVHSLALLLLWVSAYAPVAITPQLFSLAPAHSVSAQHRSAQNRA